MASSHGINDKIKLILSNTDIDFKDTFSQSPPAALPWVLTRLAVCAASKNIVFRSCCIAMVFIAELVVLMAPKLDYDVRYSFVAGDCSVSTILSTSPPLLLLNFTLFMML